MAETKFTPGPWARAAWNDWTIVADEPSLKSGFIIAEVLPFDEADPTDMDDANAHLIAAAPGLYAALEVALEPCERGEICPVCDEQPHREDCMAVAALAKARGEA